MPEISISDKMYGSAMEFKRVFETVIDGEIEQDTYFEVLLGQGVDAMIEALLGPLGHDTLLRSIQQLGAKYPEQVYSYIAETMKSGESANIREQFKRQIGFRLPLENRGESGTK